MIVYPEYDSDDYLLDSSTYEETNCDNYLYYLCYWLFIV